MLTVSVSLLQVRLNLSNTPDDMNNQESTNHTLLNFGAGCIVKGIG